MVRLGLVAMLFFVQVGASSSATQEVLDVLAEPLAVKMFRGTVPPAKYADWTEAQRKTVPHEIAQHCLWVWTQMDDGGQVPLLPAEMKDERGRLAQDVCVAAKMPKDWPGRKAMVADVSAMLKRAGELGLVVRMPVELGE